MAQVSYVRITYIYINNIYTSLSDNPREFLFLKSLCFVVNLCQHLFLLESWVTENTK